MKSLLAPKTNLAFVGILLLCAFSVASSEPVATIESILVDTAWVVAHLDDGDLRVVDFRKSSLTYRLGHIPGSIHLPRDVVYDTIDGIKGMLPPVNDVADALGQAGIGQRDRIVIYDDSDGLWASRLFWALEVIGHERIHILDGGYRSWKDEELPKSRKKPDLPGVTYTASPNTDLVVDTAWMMDNIENGEVRLIDSRSPGEYRGDEKQAKRTGHVPRAVNIEWIENLASGAGSSFLPETALPPVYAILTDEPRPVIVAYCQTGVRASHTYFALRLLGYSNIKVYDGSWEVWGNRTDTPITGGKNVSDRRTSEAGNE